MEEQKVTAGGGAEAKRWLLARVSGIDRTGGPERRHETLMERAEKWGVPLVEAEEGYALAEEERLDPELGLLLLASGWGVTELKPVVADLVEPGQQQAPPQWVAGADLAPGEAQRERRLRLSYRRLRSLLGSCSSAAEAIERFLAEPDVVDGAY